MPLPGRIRSSVMPDPTPPSLGSIAAKYHGGPGSRPSRPEKLASDRLRRIATRVARLGGWRVDLDPLRLHWSPEAAALHEEPADVSPSLEAGLNYIAPEYRASIKRTFARCVKDGAPFDVVTQLITATGRRIWVRAMGEAVTGGNGKTIAIEGAFQDISYLVSMQDEADTLSRRLHHTLENISDAFYLLDYQWRFTFINRTAEELLQRNTEDLIGRSIWDEFPETVGGPFEASYRKAVHEGRVVRFHEYYEPLDSWFEVDTHPTPEGLGVYFRDISRRIKAEEDIRATNERLRLVGQATNDVVWDWDLVSNTLWWNENFEHLFGYPHDDAAGDPVSWSSRIHPEDAPRILKSIRQTAESTQNKWIGEYRFMHKDGHALSIIDRGSVIRDDDGKPIRMVGSMLDVSPQRELESRLRQAQKLEALGQLTGGIAHDFNNLLTVISGSAELLCEEYETSDQPRQLAMMIATAAQRGAELTDRLLAFGRKQPLRPQPIDLGHLVEGMGALLWRTLGEQIIIDVTRPETLWTVEIDPTMLENALLNLAINARDAMINGGCLTIDLANTSVDRVGSDSTDPAPGQYVLLTVSDTGCGIAQELLPKVFEPFFTTKEVGKGSGLGLSMVYGFVIQSGGHIQLHSEVGVGTSIQLFIPRSTKAPTATPRSPAQEPFTGNGELILVVEDNELVRHHVTGLLGGLGYSVLQASAAYEGLELIRSDAPIAVLFTDLIMPGRMDGAALAKEALKLRPDLRVLFTTGYAGSRVADDGLMDLGAELVQKPYSRDELAAAMRRTFQ
jgi:PAS domain S-box-containing protein